MPTRFALLWFGLLLAFGLILWTRSKVNSPSAGTAVSDGAVASTPQAITISASARSSANPLPSTFEDRSTLRLENILDSVPNTPATGQTGLLTSIIRFALTEREAFAKDSLLCFSQCRNDELGQSYLLIVRALVLGPESILGMEPWCTSDFLNRVFLVAIGARQLSSNASDDLLNELAYDIVHGPSLHGSKTLEGLHLLSYAVHAGHQGGKPGAAWTDAFGQVKNPDLIPVLLRGMSRGDRTSKMLVLDYLAPLGDERIMAWCSQVLRCSNPMDELCDSTLDYLARSGMGGLDVIRECIQSTQPDTLAQSAMLTKVAERADESTMKGLESLLRSPQSGTRIAAVWALSSAKEEFLDRALAALEGEVLHETVVEARLEMIRAIGSNVRQRETRGRILAQVVESDPMEECRDLALETLFVRGYPQASEMAERRRLLDPSVRVREKASSYEGSSGEQRR